MSDAFPSKVAQSWLGCKITVKEKKLMETLNTGLTEDV